ncbi:hypothetical protein KY333_03295 [Candidatus Woesearchaeota archaeon]|nr:hypothetical protein [Candidatus Woesearchaeota archaeon]MBW2993966.1 hypothetical protein [Candidatus Woesearchaeota archaeon]
MKRGFVLLMILAVIVLAGCAQKQLVGGDRDVHGCIGSAGYTWCAPKQKCLRVWEEPCVTSTITNFAECVAAGYPVMESYPEQCSDGVNVFVADRPELKPEQPIGGERNSHGCLGPAGYSWSETIQACIRTWELDETQTKAAKIAVEHNGPEYGLTVIEVMTARCPGCFTVKLSTAEHQEKQITLANWEVTQGMSGADVIFPEDCVKQGGRVVNVVGGFDCEPGEEKIGDITVFISPNICCK